MLASQSHHLLVQRLLKGLNRTRTYPLTSTNLNATSIIKTPEEFHSRLCHLISTAQERISLAALYIGTGATQSEKLFLKSIQMAQPGAQIIMDENRAGRPVGQTSSARSVLEALVDKPIYLYQTLKDPLKTILSTPINEAVSVFHIKSFVVDNNLILSGANLSQEYFQDRQDRYIQIYGGKLVEFYKEIMDILSSYANHYPEGRAKVTQEHFTTSLGKLFERNDYNTNEDDVVAYAIPTFQHPTLPLPFPSDKEQLRNLFEITTEEGCSVKLASAYLNPTPWMISYLLKHKSCDVLTAGPISHGFAPKPGMRRVGDFVTPWYAAKTLELQDKHGLSIKWYNRPGWTFHAKGLWIISPHGKLVAAVVGSGNYGFRSEYRDLESNCILIFPQESSAIQEALLQEW
eukprot:CAMPEP_0194136340 /NCGR_PEP_ID=MMETSP0152-20130528/6368_1 /TAXON_ID=1049557 /ORGANISM="Thalassiothrix antarctica, Strain L6-D1" /LENGTH=402 /DNA_ID=CAMNT_0038832955 /DNA_START=52 /DNA_END=1257 /DNA_ORIENTATION=-